MCFAKVISIRDQLKYLLTLQSALQTHTHQEVLDKYAATRPNRFGKRRILTDY